MASLLEKAQATISQNLGGPLHNVGPANAQFNLEQVPDLTGKVALVTGGSEGIGYGCSHTLLSHNLSKLFILSVSKEVVDGARGAIAEELGQDKADRTVWLKADLSDWARVQEVANQIQSETDRLDIVINNAARGIMTAQLDSHNIDRHMSVSLIGHVVLVSTLLPLLKRTADQGHTVRIVNTASNVHEQVPKDQKFDSIDDINNDIGPMAQYGRAKLAKILYARYLARHLTPKHPKILANAIHPGVVLTKMSEKDIHEPYPLGGYGMSVLLKPFKKDQFEGCVSSMYAATVTEKSGEYICPPAAVEPGSELSRDEALADSMIKLTQQIISDKLGAKLESY